MNTSILVYILAGAVVILFGLLVHLQIRFKKIFMGTKAKDLEGVMYTIGRHMEQLEGTQKEINKHLELVDSKMKKTIRNIETIRFNPFEEAGSNQSFAIAMLNDEGDGVVLSSLYARDRMSIFAKPVKKHTSTFDLSKEEKDVVAKAK